MMNDHKERERKFHRGFQWDLARQMERVDYLIGLLPRYAGWGYDQVCLYLEDAFAYPSVPSVGRRGALTPRQMEIITRTAGHYGISVIPVVPLMGHASYLMKSPALKRLSEIRDADGNPLECGQICPLHPETLSIAEKLLRDIAPHCTGGLVHVGLDESFDIGRCPRCREEIARIGLAGHFSAHVNRLGKICQRLGLKMGMWGDMLYYVPDAIPLLPKDVTVFDWYYYPFRRKPKIELYNFREVDSLGRLVEAGIEAIGCPNNGPFGVEPATPFLDRLRNIISWWDYSRRLQARGMLITSWSPRHTSQELNVVVDAAAAGLWLDPDERAPQKLLEGGMRRVWGTKDSRTARLLGSVEKYQYTGYFRWQTYNNWRALATGESAAPFRAEEKHFRALRHDEGFVKTSPSFQKILEIRHYIARKDLFLSEGAARLFEARKLVAQGRAAGVLACLDRIREAGDQLRVANKDALRATRAAWRRTRSASEENPLEQILLADRRKLTELKNFVRRSEKDFSLLANSNPLTGPWHLLFQVMNTRPALQSVVVQLQDEHGIWKDVYAVWSLEFTAEAGHAKADFCRTHSVALEWNAVHALRLRLGVRGFGQLGCGGLRLTNGIHAISPSKIFRGGGSMKNLLGLVREGSSPCLLGIPAPRSGFPPMDSKALQGWVEMVFDQGFDVFQ